MKRPNSLISAALAVTALAATAPAANADAFVPGQVIVQYKESTSADARATIARAAGRAPMAGRSGTARRVRLSRDETVRGAVRRLSRDPRVAWAQPDYVVRASGLTPNDPAYARQWNLHGPFGIGMPDAWEVAGTRGAAGGRGAVVAVVDSGVAYENFRYFRRAPDLAHFVKGYDFVGKDTHPNDENGHGTHIAGTIAQSTNNAIATAGIAYDARIMPVRTLDAQGIGGVFLTAAGIRYAARNGADVINISLEIDDPRARLSDMPVLRSALHYARARGTLVVGAAGNFRAKRVALPARSRYVLSVGATTVRGCLSNYSTTGRDLDVVAPGGGRDARPARTPYDRAACRPGLGAPDIYQQTLTSLSSFGLVNEYEGTSMAAAHVSGVAALLIATRRLGANPSPAALERQLERTSRDLGAPGFDARYGYGLLNASSALRLGPSAALKARRASVAALRRIGP